MCSEVHGKTGSYRELLNYLRMRTKMKPTSYKLPKYQPLYIDEDVAYCFDPSTCTVYEVAIRCMPFMPCELYRSKYYTDANAEGAKYLEAIESFIELAVEEILPRDPELQKELFRQIILSLKEVKNKEGILSKIEALADIPAYERLAKGFIRFVKIYGSRLPKPKGIQMDLVKLCPNNTLAKYYRFVKQMEDLALVLRQLESIL